VCKACGSRDAAGAGKLAHFQQQFAKDLDPASPAATQTLGEMTDRLKVHGARQRRGMSARQRSLHHGALVWSRPSVARLADRPY
jgi:hypothetical protein